MKKTVLSLILVLGMLSFLIVPAAAASYENSDDGTYSMTGGIFYKQAFSKGTKMRITVLPKTGTAGCDMSIYTAKSTLLGWQGADAIDTVSSVDSSVTTYTTTQAVDGLYFRNWSGDRWTGSFTVEW